ncbi:MAG TPA: hypothetical protein G4O00_08835 [Thermoflexia bacterium]|jgi:cytochrome c5|nr:hypothetical protein [Thermoflexia bacterium]
MKRSRDTLLLFVTVLAAIGLLVACGGPATSPSPTQESLPTVPPQEERPTKPPPTAAGLTLLEERCTACHTLDRVGRAQKTYEQWSQSVDRMIAKGAQLNDEERAILLKYLAETYGP